MVQDGQAGGEGRLGSACDLGLGLECLALLLVMGCQRGPAIQVKYPVFAWLGGLWLSAQRVPK